MTKFIRIQELSEITGIPVGTLRGLWAARKIPGIKAGHRTLLFQLEKVERALERLEVKAVA